jgi:hypothetical protein
MQDANLLDYAVYTLMQVSHVRIQAAITAANTENLANKKKKR